MFVRASPETCNERVSETSSEGAYNHEIIYYLIYSQNQFTSFRLFIIIKSFVLCPTLKQLNFLDALGRPR
jgi:hypothetical protein